MEARVLPHLLPVAMVSLNCNIICKVEIILPSLFVLLL